MNNKITPGDEFCSDDDDAFDAEGMMRGIVGLSSPDASNEARALPDKQGLQGTCSPEHVRRNSRVVVADTWSERSLAAGHRSLLARKTTLDRRAQKAGDSLFATRLNEQHNQAGHSTRKSIVDLVSDITARLASNKAQRLVRPTDKRLAKWDAAMGVMLLFVALVTPFEIAFLSMEFASPRGMALFVANRIVEVRGHLIVHVALLRLSPC